MLENPANAATKSHFVSRVKRLPGRQARLYISFRHRDIRSELTPFLRVEKRRDTGAPEYDRQFPPMFTTALLRFAPE